MFSYCSKCKKTNFRNPSIAYIGVLHSSLMILKQPQKTYWAILNTFANGT